MTTPVLAVLALPLLWNAAMLVLFLYYRRDMLKSPGAKFVFGISDLWALMVGLSPLLMLTAHLIKIQNYDILIVVLGVGVPHGLAGTYFAALYNSFMRHNAEYSQWAAFFSTAAGAFLGTTLFAVVSLLLLFVVAFSVGFLISTFPIGPLLLIAFVVLWKLGRAEMNASFTKAKPASNVAETSNERSGDA